jgi:hypothetical protein
MRGSLSKKIGAFPYWGIIVAGSAAALLFLGAASTKSAGGTPRESSALLTAEVKALERSGLTAPQAKRGIETQVAVDEAALVSKLEAALGDGFSGVWLEPETATLHVGVTSKAGRAVAESVAEQAGLADHVVEAQVRSTWAQLTAAQQHWSRRLADLLRGAEAGTYLSPEANALVVKLSSDASPGIRAELERAAASSQVRVLLTSVPANQLTVELQASRCKKWAEKEAFCDPTIAAGVRIESEDNHIECTAGPAVITKNPVDDTTETFILTAGHCIRLDGELPSTWYAFDKNGNPHKLGEAVEFLDDFYGDKVDVAAIKVENAYWMTANQTPVHPAIAPWGALEPEPFAVEGGLNPVKGHTTCVEAQRTGFHCGTIASVNAELEGLENLAEVEGVETELNKGDSGAPWYSVEEGSLDYVEGTHVGRIPGTGDPVFEPLETSLEELAANDQQYDLELLTTANETRPKCPMPGMKCFEAESYPVTMTGSQTGSNTFGFESQSVQCSVATFSTTLTEGSETLEVPPAYSSCLSGVTSLSIDVNECKYKFAMTSEVEEDKYKGTVDVACPSGKSIAVTSACGCTITIGSQTALGTVEYVDTTSASPKKDVDVKLEISGLKYTEGSGCKTPGTRSNGTYSGELTLKGDTEGGSAQGVWVSG